MPGDAKRAARSTQRRPRRLDRTQVVRAAVALVDEHGAEALTMRRLGRALGVEAMSLYAHVSSRENLIDGVIESVVDDLFNDPDTKLMDTDGWQDYLIRVAHSVRRSALAHPQVFPILATKPPEAPWLRPPLRSLQWVESFLASLRTHGFDDDAAVYTYRAFTSFLLGHLLLEVGALGVQTGPLPEPSADAAARRRAAAGPALKEYPAVRRLRRKLMRNAAQTEFEESLENLLYRLEDVRAHGVP